MGLPPQSSVLLPYESAVVLPMIEASDLLPPDDIPASPGPQPNSLGLVPGDWSPGSPRSAQRLVGPSTTSRLTVVASIAPLATIGTTVPSAVDPAPTSHPNGTRLKNNIKQSKVHIDGTVTYFVVRSSVSESTSHITAMKHPL